MNRLFVLLVLWLVQVSANAETPMILVFGDSISAGYGLPRVEQGWVALLQAKLKNEGYGYEVINASVSGETTAGGLARLPRALALHHPQIVILELGGNDGLRALAVEQLRANLSRMIELSTAAGAKVLLLGMRIPPNYGPEYTAQFSQAYSGLAHQEHVDLVPFLLNGIALSADLMQDDGIHPNQAGQPRLLENVWPALERLLERPAPSDDEEPRRDDSRERILFDRFLLLGSSTVGLVGQQGDHIHEKARVVMGGCSTEQLALRAHVRILDDVLRKLRDSDELQFVGRLAQEALRGRIQICGAVEH